MKRYGLIVGIDKYKPVSRLPYYGSPTSLNRAKSDAQAVYELLREHGDFNDLLTLYDSQATEAELKKALNHVLLEQGKQAEVLIYFAGHGFTAQPSEFERQGYLATYDCQVRVQDDVPVNVEQGLSFEFLNGVIGKAQREGLAGLAVFLDCCESELIIEDALIGHKLSRLTQKGCFLSTACRSFEVAREDARYGLYTGALVAALTDEADVSAGNEITVSEAHNRVERALKESGQEPIAFGYGSSMVMVRYRGAGVAQAVSEVCPYQGLNAFTPETAQFFFGRDDEVAELCQKLRTTNFVPVLGPSGSGKSSVVRAGLVKRLQTEGWQTVTMKPDKQPMVELERVLRQFFETMGFSTGRVREVMEGLGFCELGEGDLSGDDHKAFPKELDHLKQSDLKLLLIVDQFEEVFTLCEDKAAQRAFIRKLFHLGEVGASRIKVVMTMRSDFVDDWLAAGLSRSVIGEDTVWLGALQGENLAAVMEQPARKQGYAFEAGLLKLLLTDVDKEENCLPLLEFALTALWDKRETQTRKLTVTLMKRWKG